MKTIRVFISGNVQGVFFRQFIKDSADKVGVKGYVRNLAGENVEIVAEGEISSYLYAVLDGSVRVTVKQTDEEGVIKDVYICTIGKSETFGEAAVFMNVERTADVFANDPVITMRIDRENLIRFIKSHPGAGIKILMIIIFSLLNKLKEANRELAFERKTVLAQNDIDALISDLMGTGS